MAPQTIDLTELLAPYAGQWVALSSDEKRVVGHGATVELALSQAKKNSESNPLLVKSPDQFSSLLL